MSILDYIKPVNTISADEAKEMIKHRTPGEYCLLDVRQFREYEVTHLPGAVLIPINELHDRLDELEPDRMTIVYCAIGGRSRAGAAILQDNGFREVYNLKGGTKAWNGLVAEGPPQTGMAHFTKLENEEEVLVAAWAQEEGARRFYEQLSQFTEDEEAKKLFETLGRAEVGHQEAITEIFSRLTGAPHLSQSPFYEKYVSQDDMEQLMEGQLKVKKVVDWAKEQSLDDVLGYCIGLEAAVYDLYCRLKAQSKEDSKIHQIYATLAAEEKDHLDRFSQLLEKRA